MRPSTFPEGTPLPRNAVEQIAAATEEVSNGARDASADEHDATTPLVRFEPEDLGTRTLMGVAPRAVRATAKSGWMEARPAGTVPVVHADVPIAHEMPPRIIVERPAVVEPVVEPVVELASTEHWVDWDRLVPASPLPRSGRADRVLANGYRVLGFGVLTAVVLLLAGYIATTAFYFFSTSWVMPVVVSPTDDKVVALKAELATQQTHRDRLAAELGELDRAIAGFASKRDDASKPELDKATAARKGARTALARQDEIVRGIQQSAYLRAVTDRSTVALVPYENLTGVTAGTRLYGCAFEMVWCRQVGSVLEVLPGEITFKHPKRDAAVRGQMVRLQLMVPEAASNAILFLDGAPLLL